MALSGVILSEVVSSEVVLSGVVLRGVDLSGGGIRERWYARESGSWNPFCSVAR